MAACSSQVPPSAIPSPLDFVHIADGHPSREPPEPTRHSVQSALRTVDWATTSTPFPHILTTEFLALERRFRLERTLRPERPPSSLPSTRLLPFGRTSSGAPTPCYTPTTQTASPTEKHKPLSHPLRNVQEIRDARYVIPSILRLPSKAVPYIRSRPPNESKPEPTPS